jgi:hypothetical protein
MLDCRSYLSFTKCEQKDVLVIRLRFEYAFDHSLRSAEAQRIDDM